MGGCQTSSNGEHKSFNMGYVQSKPVVAAGGRVVSIRYTGGDPCHVGQANQASRSTRITFICSSVQVCGLLLSILLHLLLFANAE